MGKSKIEEFVHCSNCMKHLPKNESPQNYKRYDIGFMKNGDIQVWCLRCEMEVGCIPADKHGVYATTPPKVTGKYGWNV